MSTEAIYCHPTAKACEANEGHGCTGHPPPHLERTHSDRGFAGYPPIWDPYAGVKVRVYESSAASVPALWLSIEPDDNHGDNRLAAHLTLDQARQVAEQLEHSIEHHYYQPSDD